MHQPTVSQRDIRFPQQRQVNTPDPGGRTILREDDGADLPATEGAADWSAPYFIRGYDEVTLLAKFTAGNADGFRVAAQVSYQDNSADAEWYDVHEDTGAGILARIVAALDPGADINVAWRMRVAAPWIRFKLWGSGADMIGSRAELAATRHMLAS